jgi:hypothetical protein
VCVGVKWEQNVRRKFNRRKGSVQSRVLMD